jgi:hypothetical protein
MTSQLLSGYLDDSVETGCLNCSGLIYYLTAAERKTFCTDPSNRRDP